MMTTESSGRSTWLQFRLRTLLTILLLAAAYWGGWVSHRAWNKRNVDEAILNAAQRLGDSAEVEAVTDAPEMIILRGAKDDVEAMEDSLQRIEAAARK
jgi:hypothetical protein